MTWYNQNMACLCWHLGKSTAQSTLFHLLVNALGLFPVYGYTQWSYRPSPFELTLSSQLKLTWNVIFYCRRHPYFFYLTYNVYLKQGIGSVYVMVDFICKGYQELSWTRVERELQNEKLLLTVRFEQRTFRFWSEDATIKLRKLMFVEWIKVHLVLTVLFLEIYLQHMEDVAKYFVSNYKILLTLYR